MRKFSAAGAIALLSAAARGQTDKYYDAVTGISFASYTSTEGIAYRVAIPNVQQAPFDVILQVVAPLNTTGWTGFSWGGTMPYNPLTVSWANGDTAMVSSRMAYGLNLPTAYAGAEYTVLKGTGVNSTHYTLTVLCKGCSQWGDEGAKTSLLPNTTNSLAWAKATKAVKTPSDNATTFNVHTTFGKWTHDFSIARSDQFDSWVANNAMPVVLPSSSAVASSSAASATTVRPSSTLSTSITSATPSTVPGGCPGVPAPAFSSVTATGWTVKKIAGGLMGPRTVIFDSAGHILMIENGKGITALTLGSDGCVASSKTLVSQYTLNHGLWLSPDGKTLYASSATSVFAWTYDAATATISGTAKTIITGMFNGGHPTRTLVIHPSKPNILIVSHGSNDNFDYASGDIKTARSCVKAFNLTSVPTSGYNYVTDGYFIGYGLRNTVGLAFDGGNMLWGVENGSDENTRTANGKTVDIHIDNPADELNYLGDFSKSSTQWFGYPTCSTVWAPSAITDKKLAVGDQFVLAPNTTYNDATCTSRSTGAKLAIQAHSAPLDIKFNSDYTALYATFHGSWNRSPSTGFKVVSIPFQKKRDGTYAPTAAVTSTSGYTDLWWNTDVTKCSTTECFRPVSIAISGSKLYITSDSSTEGELFVLSKS